MSIVGKTILLVTYVYPPFAAVGVFRIVKFCKYLHRLGASPVVLTSSDPDTMAQDESLLEEIPDDVPVYRTYALEPFRPKREQPPDDGKSASSEGSNDTGQESRSVLAGLKKTVRKVLSIPDQHRFWVWTGLMKGLLTVRREKVDIVLSSSPPPSTHLLASRIARLMRKPHIVDFRDLWTQNTSYHERHLTRWLARWDRRLERRVLKRAAAIAVNTATFKRQLLDKNEFLDASRIEVVTNGVDPEDFRDIELDNTSGDKFRMVYTGSIYGKHRNPAFFFEAVRQWCDRHPGVAERVSIDFYGNWDPGLDALISDYRLNDIVASNGWLPQREVISKAFSANLLLLFQGFDPILESAIPRKLFEYLISNIPILAFAPPGEIPDLIHRYNSGECFSSEDPEPIAQFLHKVFNEWITSESSGGRSEPALRSMPEFETLTQVRKLADLAGRVIEGRL